MTEPTNGDGRAGANPPAQQALCAQVFIDEQGQLTFAMNEGIPDKLLFLLELQGLIIRAVAQNIGIERRARKAIAVPSPARPRNLKRV